MAPDSVEIEAQDAASTWPPAAPGERLATEKQRGYAKGLLERYAWPTLIRDVPLPARSEIDQMSSDACSELIDLLKVSRRHRLLRLERDLVASGASADHERRKLEHRLAEVESTLEDEVWKLSERQAREVETLREQLASELALLRQA